MLTETQIERHLQLCFITDQVFSLMVLALNTCRVSANDKKSAVMYNLILQVDNSELMIRIIMLIDMHL